MTSKEAVRYLVLWNPIQMPLDSLQRQLQNITESGTVKVCMNHAGEALAPEGVATALQAQYPVQDIETLLNNSDSLLVGGMSAALYRKLLEADTDDVFCAFIVDALCAGKSVSCLFEPWMNCSRLAKMNPIRLKLEERCSTLRAMGITLLTEDNSHHPVDAKKELRDNIRGVYTEEDIKFAFSQGQTQLEIKEQDCITPLAQDTAKELNITIQRRR